MEKNWGIPYKVTLRGSKYPFVDINTYVVQDGHIHVNPEQLINGHIHTFHELSADIFPLTKVIFEGISTPVPCNWEGILKNQYGEDVLDICKVTYNHKQTKKEYYENKDASEHVILTIPTDELNEKWNTFLGTVDAVKKYNQ